MYLKIVKSTGREWYKKCIGKTFKIHSESRNKYIVKLEKVDIWLNKGWIYGYVDKKHCILLRAIQIEKGQIRFNI